MTTKQQPIKRKRRPAPLQDAILEVVRDYKVAHDGNSPTYAEIGVLLGKSPGRIHEKVQRLVAIGCLAIDGRGKIILGGQYIPPDEEPLIGV